MLFQQEHDEPILKHLQDIKVIFWSWSAHGKDSIWMFYVDFKVNPVNWFF